MKKLISLLLILCMALPFGVLAEEATPVKTGLSFITTLTSSKDGQSQADLALVAVLVDDNGVIVACEIDFVQGKIKFDETGVITTDMATEFQSKQELGDGYGMRKASSISAEWNEQADAFAAYCVGKTVGELVAMPLTESQQPADIVSSCTLKAAEFLPGVIDAVGKATHMGAQKGDTLKLVQYSTMSKSKNATETADGQTQVYAHVAAISLNGEVITSCYIDAVQANVKFNAQGKITSDLTAPVKTKNEIKEGYGMKDISPIGKEWYEQTAAFCAFITGKTLPEAIAIATTPAEYDVISSCTISTGDFVKLLEKAAK